MPRVILAGDVGGTKTRLALFAPDGSPRDALQEQRHPSRDHASLDELVLAFLASTRARPTAAAFGIAGPVVHNRTDTTNLPWTIDGDRLGERIGAPTRLLNDLEATGWGVGVLQGTELLTLQAGNPAPGNRALIAAGTGLGEGLLVWDGHRHRPSPSEGGHTDFASRDEVEDELLHWLRAKYHRVSYERILSGPGLADLYRFFTATARGHEPSEVGRQFEEAPDPAVVVSQTGLDGTCERSRMVLERFAMIYGAEAGNLALKCLSVNGLFVGGGIAPRIRPILELGGFAEAFRDKGRLRPVLEQIPVHLILDDRAALWGAAAYAYAHRAALAA
jgi:glucokinase